MSVTIKPMKSMWHDVFDVMAYYIKNSIKWISC